MERRHELVLGVERHLRSPRHRRAGLLGTDPHLRGEHDECCFGGVTDDRSVVADRRITGEHQSESETREVRLRFARNAQDLAGLRVAAALDSVPLTVGEHFGRGHRVHRQRARLVAVDDRRAAEGLDIREGLHDRLGLGEMPRPRGQHRLHERRQPDRNRRDRGRDAQQDERLRVLTAGDADDGDDRHSRPGEQTEDLGHAVELTLER